MTRNHDNRDNFPRTHRMADGTYRVWWTDGVWDDFNTNEQAAAAIAEQVEQCFDNGCQ